MNIFVNNNYANAYLIDLIIYIKCIFASDEEYYFRRKT